MSRFVCIRASKWARLSDVLSVLPWNKYWKHVFMLFGIIETSTSHASYCCCCLVTSVVSDSVWPHRQQHTRLRHPWDSPGKNTGVGCHFLLPCMKVKSESQVAQSYPTLSVLSHKKEWNNAVCSNMDGSGDYHTWWSKPDKYQMKLLICRIWKKMIQMNLFTKQKKTHRHRKQIYCYQRGKWAGIN